MEGMTPPWERRGGARGWRKEEERVPSCKGNGVIGHDPGQVRGMSVLV